MLGSNAGLKLLTQAIKTASLNHSECLFVDETQCNLSHLEKLGETKRDRDCI